MHRDETMRFLSVARSSDIAFDQDDSGLLARMQVLLLNQTPTGQVARFASRLLDLFSAHSHYQTTKRVCLTKRMGVANQIRVASVASNMSSPNIMEVGYSCFVNADGSLFRLRPSEIRTFYDSQHVARSFTERGLPVQRSIQYIADMGLKSGICLALPHRSHSAGFLFLNSPDSDLVEVQSNKYCLLSYLQTIATLVLLESGLPSDSYYDLASAVPKAYYGAFFDATQFRTVCLEHLRVLDHEVEILEVEANIPHALVSFGNIANLTMRFAAAQGVKRMKFRIDAAGQYLKWRVACDAPGHLQPRSFAMQSIFRDFKALEMPIEMDSETLLFETTIDSGIANHAVAYSVANT